MIKIKVPATSANIGPGFDCLGMAFDLYNEYTFEAGESGGYHGFAPEYRNDNNLVYTSMAAACRELGIQIPKAAISIIKEEIPVSRGLGSSAACIIAGVAAAGYLSGKDISFQDIFDIASVIEGHPDNAAPAVWGGMTAAAKCGEAFRSRTIEVAEGIAFYALIPDFRVSTKRARDALPKNVPRSSAVFNVAAVSMLITSLQKGDFNLLGFALRDRLHQPYRSRLIHGLDEIIHGCSACGAYGAFLSGAGPTVMALTPEDDSDFEGKIKSCLANYWECFEVKRLNLDRRGLVVEI
ncbi:MAG: homoserine kinase [Oscillospiraceae bacterium]|jgi:homoserine kinase|nr:homoserine kinase [Oscillospiraceae bacterium]